MVFWLMVTLLQVKPLMQARMPFALVYRGVNPGVVQITLL
jgi:hypothetical protein